MFEGGVCVGKAGSRCAREPWGKGEGRGNYGVRQILRTARLPRDGAHVNIVQTMMQASEFRIPVETCKMHCDLCEWVHHSARTDALTFQAVRQCFRCENGLLVVNVVAYGCLRRPRPGVSLS